MSNAFAAPLRLELRPSRLRKIWLLGVHSALLLPIPWLPSLAWQLGYALIALINLYRHWQVEERAVLLWDAQGDWHIEQGGDTHSAQLAGTPRVHTALVSLPLKRADRRRVQHWLLFADAVDADALRRLRVRLRSLAEHANPTPTQ